MIICPKCKNSGTPDEFKGSREGELQCPKCWHSETYKSSIEITHQGQEIYKKTKVK